MRELFKHGLIYGFTSSLQNLLFFVLLPLFTIYYTPAEFGVYSLILLSGTLANAIFYLGAGSALGRFYFDDDTSSYRKRIISSALFVTFIGALLLICSTFFLKHKLSIFLFSSSNFEYHLFYGFLGTAFGFLLNILTLVLRYEKKSKSFMVVTIFGVILNFLITYIFLVKFRLGILAPILGTMLSNGMSLLFLFLFMMNSIVGKIQHDLIKILLNFGLQSSITGICFFFLDWVDRLIIKELLPMSDVGIYSLAYRLGSMINVILVMPFSLIWAPIRLQYLKKDVNDVFVTKVISYFFLAGIFIVFIATSYSNLFMSVFFKNKEYYEASKIFPIIMLAMLIFGLQNILDFGIYYYKKIYYYIFISIIGILFNVGFNVLFIPKYGIYAAAYITLATYLLSTTLIFITSNKYHLIRIEWVRITILAVFILVIYYLMYFTNIFNFYGDIKRLFLIFFSIVLFYRFWFDKKERDQILLFLKK